MKHLFHREKLVHFRLLLTLFWVVFLNILLEKYSSIVTATNLRARSINRLDLKCDGELPDWRLPTFTDWNPNSGTLQEVCAISEFQGHVRSVRAFCGAVYGPQDRPIHPNGDASISPIIMDNDPRLNPYGGSLQNRRLFYYCQKRCYCRHSQAGNENTIRPLGYSVYDAIVPAPRSLSYVLYVDFNQNLLIPLSRLLAPEDDQHRVLRSITLRGSFEAARQAIDSGENVQYTSETITLNDRNKISCQPGAPPNFRFPNPPGDHSGDSPPFQAPQTIQKLCAIGLSGGNPGFNAGGYCYDPAQGSTWWEQVVGSQPEADVWFSDELTPRHEWTPGYNWYFSESLRFFCWLKCRCLSNPKPRKRPKENYWRLVKNGVIQNRNDGSTWIIREEGGGRRERQRIQPPPAPASGRTPGKPKQRIDCVVEGVDYCAERPWPSAEFGPKPTTPPSTSRKEPPLDLPTCGQSCEGPANKYCSEAEGKDECRCVSLPPQLKLQLGIPDTRRIALCLVTSLVASFLSKAHDPGDLRKRQGHNITFLKEESGWACPCNQSYVSQQCCESRDGLIWEHSGLKLGELGQL